MVLILKEYVNGNETGGPIIGFKSGMVLFQVGLTVEWSVTVYNQEIQSLLVT